LEAHVNAHQMVGRITLTVAATVMVLSRHPVALARRLPSTYCGSSGDLCQSVTKVDGVRKLRISMSGRYFRSYDLCVTSPNHVVFCEDFRIRAWNDGRFGDSVRWRKHFSSASAGRYVVAWYKGVRQGPGTELIGEKLSFRK
jgi:hypothetical protein